MSAETDTRTSATASSAMDGWRALVSRPELADLTLVLETPGDAERHAEDIALLRSLAG